jgi:hypothetical protein
VGNQETRLGRGVAALETESGSENGRDIGGCRFSDAKLRSEAQELSGPDSYSVAREAHGAAMSW